MTIANETSRNDYIGNNTTDTYNYTFKIFSKNSLRVTKRVSGVETPLTVDVDYTVTGVGYTSGGTIILTAGNLLDDHALTIRRVRAITQGTDIRNQGDFYPEVHEDEFDRNIMIDQQQQDSIDRSMKVPESVSPSDFDSTLPATINDIGSANAIIGINETADGFKLVLGQLTGVSVDAGTGLIAKTGATSSANRTLQGAANQIDIADGDGVAGNPSISIASSPVIQGLADIGGVKYPRAGVDAGGTLTKVLNNFDDYVSFNSFSALTCFLPQATTAISGKEYTIVQEHFGGAPITISAFPTNTIREYGFENPTTTISSPGEKITLRCDGLNNRWVVTNRITPFHNVFLAGVIWSAFEFPPAGFLYCDGSAVSRSTYVNLWNILQTRYGQGDGFSTFNVPDLRGKFIRGQSDGTGNDPDAASRTAQAAGGNTGDNIGSVQGDQFDAHTHGVFFGVNTGPGSNTSNSFNSGNFNSGVTGTSNSTGGSETRPKNIYMKAFIRY